MKDKGEVLILLTGKSASGKDAIQKYLCENYKYNRVVPYTTRPPRANESQGDPYYFIDKETFYRLQDGAESLLMSEFRGWYYGYNWKDIDNTKNPVMVVDNVQLDEILRHCIQTPIIIYLDRNKKDRYINQLERGTDITEVYRRAIHDDAAYQTVLRIPYIYRIDNNGTVEETVEEILMIVADVLDNS